MNTIEDGARAAMREIAGTVTDAPALRLDPARLQAPQSAEARKAGEHALRRLPSAARPVARRTHRIPVWLAPVTAAASIVAIVLAAVSVGHVNSSHATRDDTAGTAVDSSAARPEFYMTTGWTGKLMLYVHRTSTGAVTASASVPGTLPQGGYVTADASDRAFYIATAPCTTADTVSRFYRATLTDSGQISGIATVGQRIPGTVTDLAISPDGSRIAYSLQTGACMNPKTLPVPQGTVHIMDLATGAVSTWQNTATPSIPAQVARQLAERARQLSQRGMHAANAAEVTSVTNDVGGLSWTADGRTLIVDERWEIPTLGTDLAVYGLDTANGGGSLQANSRLLWSQDYKCVTCVVDVLAGPGDTLTAAEIRATGKQQTLLRIVRIPLAAGRAPILLWSELSPTPGSYDNTGIFTDSSGQWVIAWPLADTGSPSWQQDRAGWISGGKLHPLPGTTFLWPNMIAW